MRENKFEDAYQAWLQYRGKKPLTLEVDEKKLDINKDKEAQVSKLFALAKERLPSKLYRRVLLIDYVLDRETDDSLDILLQQIMENELLPSNRKDALLYFVNGSTMLLEVAAQIANRPSPLEDKKYEARYEDVDDLRKNKWAPLVTRIEPLLNLKPLLALWHKSFNNLVSFYNGVPSGNYRSVPPSGLQLTGREKRKTEILLPHGPTTEELMYKLNEVLDRLSTTNQTESIPLAQGIEEPNKYDVKISSDFHTWDVNGDVYHFTKSQSKVMQALYIEWKQTKFGLSERHILKELLGTPNSRLYDRFRNSEALKDRLIVIKKGLVTLNLPPDSKIIHSSSQH